MDQRKNAGGSTSRVYNVDVERSSQRSVSVIESDLSNLVRLEIRRAMQEHNNTLEHDTNLVDLEDFAANTLPNKGKFDYRSTRCVFLGYAHGCKGYKEPSNFIEAQQEEEWRQAMKSEIQALERNGTWELVKAPTDKKPIGCRWIYKLKLKPDGSIEGYKARLVAKGYNQVEGEDYTDCFAPVAKAVTVRLFLAVAVSKGWAIHHLDVNNAFLHGSLKEDIYMDPPEGYEVKPGYVCKLRKSLYGLKQASRQWNQKFTEKLEVFGFVQSKNDYCLFTKEVFGGQVALLVYVDDILVTAPSESCIQQVKEYLHDLFTIKDLGLAKYFLGIELARSSQGLLATQTKYISDIVKDAGLTQATATNTPLPAGIKFTPDSGALLPDPSKYHRLVGRILYLGFTRPDISHAAQQLSQYLQHPCQLHWDAAIHLVKYLKGCTTTVALVSWKTKKQATVSKSIAEAEYRSLASTVCELTWISYLLQYLGISFPKPIPLFCDNKAAVHITANPVFHERTKHLEIDCHIVRDKFKEGFVTPTHISAKEQIADILTKPLTGPAFQFMKSKLNLLSLPPSSTCGGDVKMSVLCDHKLQSTGVETELVEAAATDL
ncbi:UNVERIFIED_CONTAM: Retrovirus-related Pol polyprotein from transposon RE2 [Sesamum radiatum]|uniref:Retrovirus-related Pol polyprotein from transposon RE2 n=1 Tax=Sesamum radiatum TaxID=300843 RepID=A0AAW2U9S2_SESRA